MFTLLYTFVQDWVNKNNAWSKAFFSPQYRLCDDLWGSMFLFGKQSLSFDDKIKAVQDVFSAVASRYDLMNDAMSLGFHRAWKRYFAHRVAAHNPRSILDMSTGTGDIASLLYRLTAGAQIVAADPNESMLEHCQNRMIDEGKIHEVSFVQTQAETLPFEEQRFDAYTISFGLRNVTDVPAALSEAFRVLKGGGRFWCMEFHPLEGQHPLNVVYQPYLDYVLPAMGTVIAGDREAYRYLADSIQTFLKPQALQEQLKLAGFTHVFCKPLMGGIVVIHEAVKD